MRAKAPRERAYVPVGRGLFVKERSRQGCRPGIRCLTAVVEGAEPVCLLLLTAARCARVCCE